MDGFETLRERWLQEQPLYERLGQRVRDLLAAECQRRGLPCEIKSRPKDVASFVKKAIRKNYTNPYEDIHDKAGVRVIYLYPDLLPQFEEVVRLCCNELHYEDKKDNLAFDQLGYLGVHFEVSLPEDSLEQGDEHRGLICEVQLHTRAQSLFADMEHELAYKPAQEPPAQIKRAIRRLVALVEIFDEELSHSRDALLGQEGFQEARVLDCLERQYFRFTTRQFDRELSLILLGRLKERMFPEPEVICRDVEAFTEQNHEKLTELFRVYADDSRASPLLFQPEAILIFNLLESNPFVLKETWTQLFPLDLLQSLAVVWGTSIES